MKEETPINWRCGICSKRFTQEPSSVLVAKRPKDHGGLVVCGAKCAKAYRDGQEPADGIRRR